MHRGRVGAESPLTRVYSIYSAPDGIFEILYKKGALFIRLASLPDEILCTPLWGVERGTEQIKAREMTYDIYQNLFI